MPNYIDNKKFEELLWKYKKDPKKYEDEFAQIIDLLTTNILHSFSFKIEFEDAKQDCFLLILKIAKNFDESKGSAFNYFTTIILNNLRAIYSKDKKYNKGIQNYIKQFQRDYDDSV